MYASLKLGRDLAFHHSSPPFGELFFVSAMCRYHGQVHQATQDVSPQVVDLLKKRYLA
ncbi:hypothetical protein SBA4_6360004 [Candidatus Sulfopaludibacter sp. SbA4]|nr:hypothetical protein SBA4_6360004 [Candidatus Sulfopaludibacter sp. SbA4]